MLIFMLTSLMLLSAWLLQALLPAHAVLAQARYPFLLALTVYVALNRRGWGMLLTALTAGLIQDLLSTAMPLGYSAVLFAGVALLIHRYRKLVVTDSPVTAACFGGVAALLVTALLYVLLLEEGVLVIPLRMGVLRVGATGLLALGVTPLVFVVANALFGALDLVLEKEDLDGIR
jgi:rod shape-determining protein MreD